MSKKRPWIALALCAFVAWSADASAEVEIEWVVVGDPGNLFDDEVPDTCNCDDPPEPVLYGSVGYEYRISKHEVTNTEYCEFLNAVARGEDPNHLYNPNMIAGYCSVGGIRRVDPEPYTYELISGGEDHPVVYVGFYNALRFVNWLHHGQPEGGQNESTTEDGVYKLTDVVSVAPCNEGEDPQCEEGIRNRDARVFLPNENEWYKAAFYKGQSPNAGYWDYATQSNTRPDNNWPEDDTGNSANYDHDVECPPDPDPDRLTDVGAYDDSDGPYGTFDQNGNVWELNEWWCDSATDHWVFRGGGWKAVGVQDGVDVLRANFATYSHTNDQDEQIGFRVASLPSGGLVGACCLSNGTCVNTDNDEADCVSQSGTYLGDWTQCLGDANENGVDDACEVKRPMPEPCGAACQTGTVPCLSDNDCSAGSTCVPAPEGYPDGGICYVTKERSLSIARHPMQVPDTARRIKLDDGTVVGWVGAPSVDGGRWVADVVENPHYEARWPDVAHVTGLEFFFYSHIGTYHVQAIQQSGDIEDENDYSEVLELPSNWNWNVYMSFDQIEAFMMGLADAYPDLCTLHDAGGGTCVPNETCTWEERHLWVLQITGSTDDDKPAVFYESLIHGNEWMAGPVLLYFADYLLGNYGVDDDVDDLVDGLDIYLVPVMNPDGYVFSYNNGDPEQGRDWRKNRRPNDDPPWYSYGTDLNRNWGYKWGYNDQGSSGIPSDDHYRGLSAFSEVETDLVGQWIEDEAHSGIVAFLDIHGYAGRVLWPWGYACLDDPDEPQQPDPTTLNTLGTTLHGLIFPEPDDPEHQPGPVYETLPYPANGCSVDWAFGERGAAALAIELRKEVEEDFQPPPGEIEPTCSKTLAGLLYLTDWALDQGIRFDFPSGLPETVSTTGGVEVEVQIIEDHDTLVPGSHHLYYRYDGGAFVEVDLTFDSQSGTYKATLPAGDCGDTAGYYLSAQGERGNRIYYAPREAPDGACFMARVGERVAIQDDVEDDPGWAFESNSSDGAWEYGAPVNYCRGAPRSDHDGTGQCFLTDNAEGDSDVDDGYTRLTSPELDLADHYRAEISYALWYTNNYVGLNAGSEKNRNEDVFKVYVSNNGVSWVLVETIGPLTLAGWVEHSFAVRDFVTPNEHVRVRFEASDYDGPSVVEAAIDDLSVWKIDCDPGEVAMPLPEDSLGVTCESDSGCRNEARCVQGVCYAPKQRYISIARNPAQALNTALRVKLDGGANLECGEGNFCWVGEPDWIGPTSQHDGFWRADIVDQPHYDPWWPDLVHVRGCEIAHAGLCDGSGDHCKPGVPNTCPVGETCVHHSYLVQAIIQGHNVDVEDDYSDALILHTSSVWGDTVGSCAGNVCRPADGIVGLDDLMAGVNVFQGNRVAPITWLDLCPSLGNAEPDGVVNVGDVLCVISAFQGQPFPGSGPLGCP